MDTAVVNPVPVQMSEDTDVSEIKRLFDLQKANRQNVKNTSAAQRRKKLRALKKAIFDHRDEIKQAMKADFRKPYEETDLTEIYPSVSEIRHAIAHVGEWMKPKKVPMPLAYMGSASKVIYEPKGTTLIISPWNYPFNLCMIPISSAIAAGCTAIVKPSEFTPNTSKVIKKILGSVFKEDEFAVVEGGVKTSTELLKLKFDHIFFTGSPQVGKIVMKAAAENLASVTLELGGKSPVIVDDTVNVKMAAKRITWGKFLNNGQTCIAPDYLYVHEKKYDKFMEEMKKTVEKFYGATPEERRTTEDYARIVNSRHHARVKQLIGNAVEKGANIAIGGDVNDSENYIGPTVLTDVPKDADIMEEEIFGPVLPVFKFRDLNEPLEVINANEKPLALYMFSGSNRNIKKVLNNTSAGGTAINDTVVHNNHPHLPFGGVNNSGIGNAHGLFGFKAFSHERAVLKQSKLMSAAENAYPPYSGFARKMIDITLKYL